jgi:superfamily II DNA or RNA helicase
LSSSFSVSDFVRLRADPQRIGVYLSAESRSGRVFAVIKTPTGVVRAPLDQIERIPGEPEDPLALLRRGAVYPPSQLRQVLAHIRLTGGLADLVYSLEATNTDFHAHQFKPVLRMLESPTGRLLVADEVGLGKTIEAGLVWTELRARFDLRRMLVLCPSVLQEKWRREMVEKFDLAAEICAAERLESLLASRSDAERGFVAICSLQGLRPPRGWQDGEGERGNSAAARLARLFDEQAEAEPLFDLVVIDEAHHLRNPATQSNALARLLHPIAQHMLFLSATPIHLRNRDLFSLLALIDAETFRDEAVLADIIEANAGLMEARRAVLGGADGAEIRKAVQASGRHPLLRRSRKLAAVVETLDAAGPFPDRPTRATMAAQIEGANLLANLVNRTRRRDVEELRVVRKCHAFKARMSGLETEVYARVTDVVTRYAQSADLSPGFLACGPQRLLASSIPAALEHWRKGATSADFEDMEIDEEGNPVAADGSDLGPLVSQLRLAAALLPDPEVLARQDTKFAELIGILRAHLAAQPDAKIVLFSSFRATLAYLERRLRAEGIGCAVMHGGTASRSALIDAFAADDELSLLLSSEVGSEGVDLQFCRVVVNYDLPWNPMRVEQRIGRIDRLGQTAETVAVLNILYADTIDEAIYDRLFLRLGLCVRALGGFEAILGEEIARLSPELLLNRMSDAEVTARLDQAAQAVENRLAAERDLETEAGALIAHGDRILHAIQTARDMHRWITPQDLADYIGDALESLFPGSRLSRAPDGELHDIRLSQEARIDYGAWLDKHRVRDGRRFLRDASTVRCRLGRGTSRGSARNVEAVGQTHPLVRFLAHRISEADGTRLRPAIAARVRAADLHGRLPVRPGRYCTMAALWRFSGAFAQDRIAYGGLELVSGTPLDPEVAEALTLAASGEGEHWPEVAAELDLALVSDECETRIADGLRARFLEAEAHRRADLSDRAEMQLATLERRISQERARLEELIARQRRRAVEGGSEGARKAASAAQMNEGKLRRLQERAAQRRARIEAARLLSAEEERLAVCVVEVVA